MRRAAARQIRLRARRETAASAAIEAKFRLAPFERVFRRTRLCARMQAGAPLLGVRWARVRHGGANFAALVMARPRCLAALLREYTEEREADTVLGGFVLSAVDLRHMRRARVLASCLRNGAAAISTAAVQHTGDAPPYARRWLRARFPLTYGERPSAARRAWAAVGRAWATFKARRSV
jgi:hypothetical protein